MRSTSFVVFELKAVAAGPEHVGKLNFYVNAVDDQLRRPEHGDGSTIGILLAADRDDVAAQYSLPGLTTPLAISAYTTYRALPDDVRPALPSIDDLTEIVREVRDEGWAASRAATCPSQARPVAELTSWWNFGPPMCGICTRGIHDGVPGSRSLAKNAGSATPAGHRFRVNGRPATPDSRNDATAT